MLRIQVQSIEKSCWFFHRWILKKIDGVTRYFECEKCKARKIIQSTIGSVHEESVDMDWVGKGGDEDV